MKDKKGPAEGTVCIYRGGIVLHYTSLAAVSWQERGVREKVTKQAGPGWVELADPVRSMNLIPNAMRRHCEVIKEGEGHDLIHTVTSPWLLVRVE